MAVVPDRAHALDHLVVLMFENRSFDHLLGRLYAPGEVPAFEGVLGRTLSNPVPSDLVKGGPTRRGPHEALDLATPNVDPGEEFPHVNTQLFGTVDPPANATRPVELMQAPFNAPRPGTPPTMSGFVADYANTFRVTVGRDPRPAELAEIMAGYTPAQLPVLSAIARGFVVFDHWFCEAPTQTFANRSFFHAASSSGFVDNDPPGKFSVKNDAPTVFERLADHGVPWKVYIDPEQLLSATGLIHARRLLPKFADRFATIYDFYAEAAEGRLPAYSFLEPNMLHPHTDMHPHALGRIREDLDVRPDAMSGGEELLAEVYDAVRTAGTDGGSNWANTALLVTFDEHGGIYDHVPPPSAPAPDPAAPDGEDGFRFDRSGVRVPTVLVSAWVDGRTVVTSEYRATSAIRTLRERWSLGPPLTERDAVAPDLAPLLLRSTARPPEDWPTVTPPRPPGRLARAVVRAEEDLEPLGRLERGLVGEALMHEADRTGALPAVEPSEMSHRDAHHHRDRLGPVLFPQVSAGRRSRG